MCMWIEEFAKTCGMGVGDEGGVYIYVYVDRGIRKDLWDGCRG